jgi:IS5 family transposase
MLIFPCCCSSAYCCKSGFTSIRTRSLQSDWTVKNDIPHYGLKDHPSAENNHGFILATTMTPASVHDTNYLTYCTIYSRHTKQPIDKVYVDKGYTGKPNWDFLALNIQKFPKSAIS